MISGLQKFSVNIIYWKWIMLCITGAIIMFVSSILLQKEEEKSVGSHIHEGKNMSHNPHEKSIKDNMKLPF